MSKRVHPGKGNPGSGAQNVEVISLLDDSSSSPSEDDPDKAAAEAQRTDTARPAKRLRRLASIATEHSRLGPTGPASSQPSRRRQAADGPPTASQRPGKLRQGTLPVTAPRPRSALPLQTLNVTRPRAGTGAAPTASGDSQLGSPAPSVSQRSRLSQDPDFKPSQGAWQPSPSSQRFSRPQLRQLTLAPVRGGGGGTNAVTGTAADCGPTTAQGPRPAGAGGANATAATGAGASSALVSYAAAPAPASTSATAAAEMWYERYAPRSEEELVQVLHRKKVSELRDWLEYQRHLLAAMQPAPSQPGRAGGQGAYGNGVGGSQWQQQPQQQQPPAWGGASHAPQPQQSQRFPMQQATAFSRGSQQQHQQPHPHQQPTQHPTQGPQRGPAPWPAAPPPPPRPRPCGVAVLSGPAGCGKSACLRVLAEVVGFQVVEWTPPPPVLWSEYQYQRSVGGDGEYGGEQGPSYKSKLDDFESFVNRSKFPSLALTAAANTAPSRAGQGGSQAAGGAAAPSTALGAAAHQHPLAPPRPSEPTCPKLLLLEDLPHTHDMERRQRLVSALRDLVNCARGPVVIVATEAEGQAAGTGGGGGGADGGGSMGGVKGLHKDILAALQSLGALTISFNPITANNITKLLLRVAAAEGLQLGPGEAVGLAETAAGDVRSALQALQMSAMLHRAAEAGGGSAAGTAAGGSSRRAGGGRKKATAAASGGKGAKSVTALLRAGRQQALAPGEVARLAAAQRDLGLPLFHALGKFLHNKRGQPGAGAGGPGEEGASGDEGGEGGDDDEAEGRAGGGRGAARGGGRGGARGGGGGGGASSRRSSSRKEDSVALQQLNTHALRSGRQWALGHQVQLPARLLRPPMRYDPEALLLRCGLEAPVLLSFLHENYLGFVDGEGPFAVEDVQAVAAYFSDSAVLCGQSRAASATAATASGGTSLWLEDSPAAANLASAIAASVAARGLMYGNTRPAAHRFNPIRAPASSAIDQAAGANRLQLRAAACRLATGPATGTSGVASAVFGGSAAQLVATAMPWLRALTQTSHCHASWLAPALPPSWSYYWNGAVTEGAFLHRVAQPPPQGQWGQQGQQQQWGGGGGDRRGGVPCGQGGWAKADGVQGLMEGLGLEDEDPIEAE